MSTPFLTLPLRPLSNTTTSTTSICLTCRHQSTYRRTRKAPRIPPDPSFAPSKTAPADHILFNPPSSMPNVYHTPQKFLPVGDPRRRVPDNTGAREMHTTSSSSGGAAQMLRPSIRGARAMISPRASAPPSTLPPVRPQYQKKYHLTPPQIASIRSLRASDPKTWTRVKLAEKFQCSQFFISLCIAGSGQGEGVVEGKVRAQRERALEDVKRRWGRRKMEAREARGVRKGAWGVEGVRT